MRGRYESERISLRSFWSPDGASEDVMGWFVGFRWLREGEWAVGCGDVVGFRIINTRGF